MPMDSQGNPRSGFGRTSYANEAHSAHTQGPKNMPAKKPSASGGGESPAGDDVSKMDIGAVVAKHGPATHVTMEKGEGGGHHVHSIHGGKHHHSDHEDAAEAHAHMGRAMGMGGEDESEVPEESPDDEESSEEAPASAGHAWLSK
jgi:hypothetical protein